MLLHTVVLLHQLGGIRLMERVEVILQISLTTSWVAHHGFIRLGIPKNITLTVTSVGGLMLGCRQRKWLTLSMPHALEMNELLQLQPPAGVVILIHMLNFVRSL